jgi:UDP-4-amino-4-deoxy-L-arabinose-oxoglutarate aminotransferase
LSDFIPFSRPSIGEEEIAAVVETLRSGWITTGPRAAEFERLFAERCGAAHALAFTSATAAMHVLLEALGIGPGDEVIVPSMTWATSANVPALLGARPVFADVLPDTLQIDPGDVRRRVTPRTKAIVPVHFAGAPADLDALREIAGRAGVPLLEDAAHALGTSYRGRPVGHGESTAFFSFHPIKNITTAEGGMITTHDDRVAARARLLRFHGVSKMAWERYGRGGSPRYEVVEPGWKYNFPDVLAAIGVVQLRRLDAMNAARVALAARYDALLADVEAVRPLGKVPYPHVHSGHLYVVRLDPARAGMDRDAFVAALHDAGVGTALHFTPVHLHGWYREKFGCREGDLPVTEEAGERILSLPLHPGLTHADQDRVAGAIRAVLARPRGPRA